MILGHDRLVAIIKELLHPVYDDVVREAGLDLHVKWMTIPPHGFVLPWTKEHITLPDNLIGFCNLRSTWARRGLIIPPTIVDPGFQGQLVIEVFNAASYAIHIPDDSRFLHLVLAEVDGAIPYKGQYQGQTPLDKSGVR